MGNTHFIDWFSLTIIFVLSVFFSMIAIHAGKKISKLSKDDDNDLSGPLVGATMALLAFMLAFTFNMSASRFDERKKLLIEEVSTIQTTYLRTELLPQPYRDEARKLIRRYVDLRVEAHRVKHVLKSQLAESQQIQDRLWGLIFQMSDDNSLGISQRLYLQSLNKMFELETKRIAVGLQMRIPSTIWLGLYLVAVLGMIAIGYQLGHKRRSPVYLNLVLAMAFSAVLTLIADLDRAGSGTVQVNQQPVLDLQKKLESLS